MYINNDPGLKKHIIFTLRLKINELYKNIFVITTTEVAIEKGRKKSACSLVYL